MAPTNPWGEYGDQLPEAWRGDAAHSTLLARSSSGNTSLTTSGAVRASLAHFSMAPELHMAAAAAGKPGSPSHQLPTITSEAGAGCEAAGDGAEGAAGAAVMSLLEQQDAAAALADAMLLWQRLPLQGRTPVGRDSLGAIGLALEQALAEAGAPCVLQVPAGVQEPEAQEWLEQWSAAEQVGVGQNSCRAASRMTGCDENYLLHNTPFALSITVMHGQEKCMLTGCDRQYVVQYKQIGAVHATVRRCGCAAKSMCGAACSEHPSQTNMNEPMYTTGAGRAVRVGQVVAGAVPPSGRAMPHA